MATKNYKYCKKCGLEYNFRHGVMIEASKCPNCGNFN